jgi:hypothetical protein
MALTKQVAKDVANSDFERWADTFEIDTDTSDLADAEQKAFEAFRLKFVKRVQRGSLAVEDGGVLAFYLDKDNMLRLDEPTGAILSARLKNDDDVQAARRMLGQWAGVPPKVFADMTLRDFNFCSELLGFFGGA